MRNAFLIGRAAECGLLDQLVSAVRSGESRVLVIQGAAGIGKSALLEHVRHAAGDLRVLTARSIEAETELPFATLHQLCASLLGGLGNLPEPQRIALAKMFGIRDGDPPDRFLIGLAVLSLLTDASAERPLLCLVDDADGMDRQSAQVLGFVARRLLAESIGLVIATRHRVPDLIGLRQLELTGLADADAETLLTSVVPSPLDPHIRERIIAEAKGNPLILRALPPGLTTTQLAGGLGLLDSGTPPARPDPAFQAWSDRLPEHTRLLLLLAAAEPVGDPVLLWRAGELLGLELALGEGLLSIEERVTFRDPLMRSAIYQAARPADRWAVHRALARVTEAPDRRAWHLASAPPGLDEATAAEIERSSSHARTRGGAAALLQRSVMLTGDPSRLADRAVVAADASLRAGDIDAAQRFAYIAGQEAQTELQRARAFQVSSRIPAPDGDLLAAARRLEPFDPVAARETYLLAWGAAAFLETGNLRTISRTVVARPDSPRVLDLVLDGCAALVTDGPAAAVPLLRRVMTAPSDAGFPAWAWVAAGVMAIIGDSRAARTFCHRTVLQAREAGALAELPLCLTAWGLLLARTGDLAAAASVAEEIDSVVAITGMPVPPDVKLLVAAMHGHADAGRWAALTHNGLRQHESALLSGRPANPVVVGTWILPELIEAAVRVGDVAGARSALDELAVVSLSCGTDETLGVLARSRALVSDSPGDHREAIDRLARTELRPDLARAHLLYGEWLRSARQGAAAREQLRTAYEMFVSMGMVAFGERARRELLATGDTARKRPTEAEPAGELTDQERQIALLVRDGFSNPEVGAQLFLSPRTVEWHLRKVFAKLSITSRRQLRVAMAGAD
jgi:DNA-binding CsgD family transcriptional regulator